MDNDGHMKTEDSCLIARYSACPFLPCSCRGNKILLMGEENDEASTLIFCASCGIGKIDDAELKDCN